MYVPTLWRRCRLNLAFCCELGNEEVQLAAIKTNILQVSNSLLANHRLYTGFKLTTSNPFEKSQQRGHEDSLQVSTCQAVDEDVEFAGAKRDYE